MKALKKILALAIMLSSGILVAQPSFYDLSFAADSTTAPYQSSGSNYVFIRSKRGTEPVKATSSGDSIKAFKIQKIILVFSELNPSDVDTREEYNQERWENLMATYPEYFQDKTTYKNVCQCSHESGNPEFKQVQGFYVYYTPQGGSAAAKTPASSTAKADVPKPATTAVAPVSTAVVKEEPKKVASGTSATKNEEPKKEVAKEEPKASTSTATKTEPAKAEPAKKVDASTSSANKKEEPKKEVAKEEPKASTSSATAVTKTEAVQPVTTAVVKEEPKAVIVDEAEEVVDTKKNPAVASKPRKAKDPRACRQACYGTGESDLNAFFKDKVVLTKKMKKDEVDLKLQLNVDGTVKKVIILGDNADLNKLVEDAAKTMVWNASVKGGLTIKSEVRMKLKYDKDSKGLKANELMVNPRLGPKCLTCTSDSELFPN